VVVAQEDVMAHEPELVVDGKSTLGEGAFWHTARGLFYWVDIEGKSVFVYDPKTNKNDRIQVKERVGTVVPKKSGGFLIAQESALATIDERGGHYRVEVELERIPNNRLNEGKCDPSGRLWVGSINTAGSGGAALYRVEKDYSFSRVLADISNSNGIVWDLKHEKMYYIDTPTMQVAAFDYNNETGEIGDPQVAVRVPEAAGWPDGMCIDAEGMLWVAMFGGNAVVRWNPQTGAMIGKIEVPARNPTSCALGGANLDQMYITTARLAMTNEQIEREPLSGGLFRCKVDVPGTEQAEFGG
jgi:sugar lactone lactonase YvrE